MAGERMRTIIRGLEFSLSSRDEIKTPAGDARHAGADGAEMKNYLSKNEQFFCLSLT